ncbi:MULTISPECIES: monovalent cation/H(+) antiporter subunit G [Saliphagus]|uniref:Monovalent cation/H(+) antiporter subunit G n=1 Tax=Saliphagus infecundisoli TaxID=1849069 RepID=A0ABD5QIB9_9EURY|nr:MULTISPECIES: monovalent cation/H(+) antiporter subunit G [Saliphagus]
MIRTLAIGAFVAAGLFFVCVAAVGVYRLPDLYTRAHSASKSDTLGSLLSLVAVGIAFGADAATIKVALLALFMLITSPTAAHAIARAAHDQGIEPWQRGDER